MALVPLKSHINTKQTAYVPYFSTGQLNASTISTGNITANTATISSIVAEYVSSISLDSEYINTSTINTLHVDLDGQILTASPTELLLNGVPIATQSSLSSIGDWALEPAISSVQMAGNDIVDGGTISSLNVRAGNGFFLNLIAFNSLFVSSNTSTISSLINSADVGIFSTLNAGGISSGTISCSTIAGDLAEFSTISSLNGLFSSIATEALTLSTLQVNGLISTPDIETSTINGAAFGASSITVEVVGVSSLVANSISSLGAEIRNALVSTIQFKPSFDVGLNFDTAALGNALQGGLTRLGIGAGVGFGVVGSGLLGAVFSRPSNTSYNTNAYYQYAVPTQLQFSTLGADTSSFTRLVSSSGAGNEVPGVEIVLSSIISSGTLCLRSLGDPTNLADPSTFTSSIQAFGEWVPVPPETLQVVSSFATASVSSLSVSSVNGLNIQSLENISTFNDLYASTISTAIIYGANSNLFGIGIQGLEIQTAPTGQVWISSPQTNIAGLTNTSTIASFLFRGRDASISSIGTSSITTSTLAVGGLSSIVFSTSGTAGTQSQPAGRLVISGNDLDLGQQDLWVQQIRLGAGNATNAQTEIIFYDAAAGQRGLQTALQDRTIRVVSTINATGGGYLLDTTINPPFFSTINNTSTALMAFFPSSVNSTIGVSTISIIPVSFQTTSAFSGTILYPNISSSAVAANVIASTTIQTNAAGSYIIAQANTSFQNAGNQYHDIYLNLAIDGVLSPSTFTSLPAGTNHYANGSIAYRQAVSSGTHTLVLYASADADGVAIGTQVDIWGTGNLAP